MSHIARHFQNISSAPQVNAHQELLAALTSIITLCPPHHLPSGGWKHAGLYSGPTSTAFLFYRLSHFYPALRLEDKTLREWAALYLDIPTASRPSGEDKVDSAHCGIAQETLAHAAVKAVLEQDERQVRRFCQYADTVVDEDEDGSDEWLYGRTGYLYLLRLIKDSGISGTGTLIDETTERVVDRIMRSSQPWTWHGKEYLGAAHGTIGIITQIVLSCPGRAGELQPLLEELLDLQFPSGNFPSSSSGASDRLVQFCHGAPGFILSLRSLAPHFPKLRTRIDDAIELAESCVWERGLLTKMPCLCHGISGNALVFEDLGRLWRFLAHSAQEGFRSRWGGISSTGAAAVASLFTGGAGRAWSWAVADLDLPRTCIGYNDV